MTIKLVKNIVLLLLLVIVIDSCDKISNTSATVTVLDDDKKVVSGASVHVFPSPSTSQDSSQVIKDGLDETKVTDNKGQVFFDYTEYYKRGQSGLFVLDMEVSYVLPDTTITVKTILKVEEQIDNQKEVVLPFTL